MGQMWQSGGRDATNRTPSVFRWGCVVQGSVTAIGLPSQGPAPPKYIRGFFLADSLLDDIERVDSSKWVELPDGF